MIKVIKYYNMELVEVKKVEKTMRGLVSNKLYTITDLKPIYKKVPHEYRCDELQFPYWYDVINKTNGKYGKIEIYDEYEPPTKSEQQALLNATMLNRAAKSQVELKKQKKLNADLLFSMAKLKGGV